MLREGGYPLPRNPRVPGPDIGSPGGGGTNPPTDPSQKAEVLGTALPMVIGTARVGPCPVIYWGAPLPGPGGRGTTWDIPYLADPATGLVRFYKGSINPAVYAVCEAPVTAVSKLYGPHFGLGVNPASSGLVYSTKGTLETIVADSSVSAWSGYVGTAAEGMAHQGTVQLRMTQCFSGEGGTPREFDAEVQGYGAGAGGESATGDAHPADVLVYLLTNTKNGLGLSSSMVNVDTGLPDANGNQTAANSYRRYCSARGWYVSIAVNERTAVVDLIASLLLATDSALVLIAGKLTAVPYGDQVVTRSTFTYTPVGTAAVIDAAELIHEADDPPVQVDRRQEKDIFGIWPVEYVDRAVAYKRLTREYIDPVWTSLYGARRADATSIDWVITPEHAGWITHCLAQRAIYQRNKYRFRLGPRWSLLTPMDLVSLSEPILGISNLIVRVTAIDEDADGTLSVEAIEWPTATAEPIDLTPQTADGVLTTNWRPIPSVPETQLNAGGGNLLTNSRLYDPAGGYGPWYKNTAADTASGQATGGPDGGTYQRLTWTATNAKHGWWAYVAGAMRPGVDYSISFYAKAGSALSTGFEVTGDVAPYDMAAVENPNLTTSWQRYVFRGYWDPTVPTTYLLLRTAAIVAAAGTLDFACAQLEEGSIATGYQPKGGEVLPGTVDRNSQTASLYDKDNLWPNPSSEVSPPPGADTAAPEWADRVNAGAGAYSGSWVRQVSGGSVNGFSVPCSPDAKFYAEAQAKRTAGSGSGGRLRVVFYDASGTPTGSTLGAYSTSGSWAKVSITSDAAPAATVTAAICYEAAIGDTVQFDALYARRIVSEAVQGSEAVSLTHRTGWASGGWSIRKVGGLVLGSGFSEANASASAWTFADLPAGARPATPVYAWGEVYDSTASARYPCRVDINTDGSMTAVYYHRTGGEEAMPSVGSADRIYLTFAFPYL